MTVLYQRQTPLPARISTVAARMGVPTLSDAIAVEKIVRQRLLTTEFQPVVCLSTGRICGFEAYARGPADSPFTNAAAMFAAAAARDLLVELDMVAQAVAADTVTKTGLPDGTLLFINALPQGLTSERPEELLRPIRAVLDQHTVVVEIDEAVLTGDPLAALAAAAHARRRGARIAVDNLGATTTALALLPLLAPDVVKLDMRLLAQAPSTHTATVLDAVIGYRNETNALVVAQGVEQETHLPTATGLGARLAQGYLFGAASVPQIPAGGVDLVSLPASALSTGDPAGGPPTLPGEMISAPGPLLRELAARLQHEAEIDTPAVVAIVCPDGRCPSGVPLAAAHHLARGTALTVVLTPDTTARKAPRMNLTVLPPNDPLVGQTILAVLTATTATALVAQAAPGGEDMFFYRHTRDRAAVTALLRQLIARAADVDQ